MQVDLRYFSGTGNSLKIIDTAKRVFEDQGHRVILSSITECDGIDPHADLLGFCFPVYAFGAPRIARRYLAGLLKFQRLVDAFVIITAGDKDESGFSVLECEKILKQKGARLVHTSVIEMPSNWTTHMDLGPMEKSKEIINAGVEKAIQVANEIVSGTQRYHAFNYPQRYSRFGFYKEYYLFKWLGVSNMWRNLRADETCNLCGLCVDHCPTCSIAIVNNALQWTNTCEQCMRCVNYCPNKAIYYKGQGSIKEKNVYFEPSFRPMKSEILNRR